MCFKLYQLSLNLCWIISFFHNSILCVLREIIETKFYNNIYLFMKLCRNLFLYRSKYLTVAFLMYSWNLKKQNVFKALTDSKIDNTCRIYQVLSIKEYINFHFGCLKKKSWCTLLWFYFVLSLYDYLSTDFFYNYIFRKKHFESRI